MTTNNNTAGFIVTGAAGFIGSNLVKGLMAKGSEEIVAVDNLTNGKQFKNLPATLADYLDQDDFLQRMQENKPISSKKPKAIFHLGACSSTTEWNGRFMMKNNYTYSKVLLEYCFANRIPLIYASSAAVYGGNKCFVEDPANEAPLNVYGYSKLLFDNLVRRHLSKPASQIVGLRYFNVYGPNEQHKGRMASVAYHLYSQLKSGYVAKLFAGYDGYADGEQRRDFLAVLLFVVICNLL